jgi:NTE family protein
MAAARTRRTAPKKRPRIGLVLGAGGVLGAAWTAGALTALQERLPVPLGTVDTVVGTSAGSVMAVALRCGFGVADIVAHQRGWPLVMLPRLADLDREAGPLPRLPRMRIGSPRLLVSTALAPHRVHPWVAASALVPEGRGRHRSLTALIDALLARDPAGTTAAQTAAATPAQTAAATPAQTAAATPAQTAAAAAAAQTAASWPANGETWIVAVDYESGRRAAFGRQGAPTAPLSDAVVASCSIPGWYEPKVINGRRYVDGGVRSSTSLDLLARSRLDEVYVLAPMASYEMDRPRHPALRLERLFRRLITMALEVEVRRVTATGTKVTVLTPGPADLAAMGGNLMDPSRRQRVLETSLQTSPVALRSREEISSVAYGVSRGRIV